MLTTFDKLHNEIMATTEVFDASAASGALFFFEGDKIVNERINFDTASPVTQIGQGAVLAVRSASHSGK